LDSWRAWHVFLADKAKTEQFLLDVVSPQVESLIRDQAIQQWFFIRYWENGPHTRLRFKGIDDQVFEELGEFLRRRAPDYGATDSDAKTRFDANMKFDGWHADPSAVPWFAQGDVHEIGYEPEFRRYGGEEGLEIAESLFNLSSNIALKIIAAAGGDVAKVETIALHLTVTTLIIATRSHEERIEFLARMALAWRGFAPDAEQAELAAREQFLTVRGAMLKISERFGDADVAKGAWSPFVRAYAEAIGQGLTRMRELASEAKLISPLMGIAPRNQTEQEAAIKSITMSLIHMMNNRLGMTPLHEYRFSQMLVWASEEARLEAAQ